MQSSESREERHKKNSDFVDSLRASVFDSRGESTSASQRKRYNPDSKKTKQKKKPYKMLPLANKLLTNNRVKSVIVATVTSFIQSYFLHSCLWTAALLVDAPFTTFYQRTCSLVECSKQVFLQHSTTVTVICCSCPNLFETCYCIKFTISIIYKNQ